MLRAGFFVALKLLLSAVALIKCPVSMYVVADEAKKLQLKAAGGGPAAGDSAGRPPLILVDLSCECVQTFWCFDCAIITFRSVIRV